LHDPWCEGKLFLNKIDFGWSDQTNPNLSYYLMTEDGLDRPSEVKDNFGVLRK